MTTQSGHTSRMAAHTPARTMYAHVREPVRTYAKHTRTSTSLELVLFATGSADPELESVLESLLERAYETPGVRELLQASIPARVFDDRGRLLVVGECLSDLPAPYHSLYNLHRLIQGSAQTAWRASPQEWDIFHRVVRDGSATTQDIHVLRSLIARLRDPFAEVMTTLLQKRTPESRGLNLHNPWGRLGEIRFEVRHMKDVQRLISSPVLFAPAWVLWHLAVRMTLCAASLDPSLYTTGWVLKRHVLGIHVIEVDLRRTIDLNPLAFVERSSQPPSQLAAWLATVAAHEVTHALTISAHSKHGEEFATSRERVGELAGMVAPVLARLITRLLPSDVAHETDPAWLLEQCLSNRAGSSPPRAELEEKARVLLARVLQQWLEAPPAGLDVDAILSFWERHSDSLVDRVIEALMLHKRYVNSNR